MEPDPPAEDVAFAKSFFSQFASIHKQRDSPADEFASRFAESNAILVLKKPSRKRDRARDPGVVAQRKLRRRRTKALAKKMSHRQLKADGLYDVNLEGRTYTDMLWMNALWEQYMARVLAPFVGRPAVVESIGPRMLKADLHGAYIKVVETRSPTHLHLAGLVLMEFRNTFRLLTKHNRFITVPKAGCVFAVRACGFVFKLYGNQLCMRAVDRVTSKFKNATSVDL